MTQRRRLRITFEDRPLDHIPLWRGLDAWEEAVLRRHLEVEFEGAETLRSRQEWPRVREMDECGCLEFEHDSETAEPHRIVTEGYWPDAPDSGPLQSMLSLTDDGHLLWLELIRFGGSDSYRPGPDSLQVFQFGTGWNPDA